MRGNVRLETTDSYRQAVEDSQPVGYWRLNDDLASATVLDQSGHGRHGVFVGAPTTGVPGALAASADSAMSFIPPQHISIPHSPDYSIQSSGQGLSVEVWMQPAVLEFPGEHPRNYVHWLGKGNPGQMEWGFRFYSMDDTQRRNRVSAYAWNPDGRMGAGAYYQGPLVQQNHWIHLVACFDDYVDPSVTHTGVQLYINGALSQGPPSSGTLYFNPPNWNVVPRGGDAPLRLGTRSNSSYFTGSLDEVAVYPRVLRADEVLNHYTAALR